MVFHGHLEYLVHWHGYDVDEVHGNLLLTELMHCKKFEDWINNIHLNLDL